MFSLPAIKGSSTSAQLPVAVFVGGTSGIGEGMARVFAEHTKGNSSIIIVGRNRAAADAILASLPKPDDNSTNSNLKAVREFVQCDVALMKNVQAAANDILSRHSKINYLILSPGVMTNSGRDETPEGIDKKMALHYYGRWAFVRELLPALQKAKDEGEDVAAMSVFAAGVGGEIDVDDLAMKKTFSLKNAALRLPTYNDLMMESFSAQYPDLKFIQAAPGAVLTSLLSSSPSKILRLSSHIITPLARPFMISAEECGENMWSAIWKTANKPGAWRIGSKGENLGMSRYFGTESQRERLWEHTEEVVNSAMKTGSDN